MVNSRTRSAQHKVYIPSSARENQYLLAKFALTDAVIEKFSRFINNESTKPYDALYQKLAKIFFDINDSLNIESGQFVANDKFTRIRFSPERITSQTEQQILFLYNPHYHNSQNAYFDGSKRVKKINLVFMANGAQVRLDSAKFHQKVIKAIALFNEEVGLSKEEVRICDHQHLTYDLFAREKGVEGTQAHKFRSIATRYLADNVVIPDNADALTYAIVDFPINRRLRKLTEIDETAAEPYTPLYTLINEAFVDTCKRHNVVSGALIANDLVPIVRGCEDETVVQNGELQMLGYNPANNAEGFACMYDGANLVDTVRLVFFACDKHKTNYGYGKFLNNIQSAMHLFADKLDYIRDREQMQIRCHQHVGYYAE